MFRYWRQTLDGLVGLACDAFEVPIVLAGEWMLRRWDKQHPQAHDIDMADALADVEAEQEVWEPDTTVADPEFYRMLAIDIIKDVLVEHRPEWHRDQQVVTCSRIYHEPHARLQGRWPEWRDHVAPVIYDALFSDLHKTEDVKP